tara:strand:- start:215 stop:1606 length:1392 start_codon:yes stop_codon:yes gene_type:complete
MTLKLQADYNRAFKAADIRGIYPTEIDDELVYFIGRAFVEEFGYKRLVVARDMRIHSDGLYEAFVKGATDSGASIVDVGMVHSPALYYASGTLDLPGVMITASHSPKDYHGLKLVHAQAIPLTEKTGLNKIRRRIERGQFIDAKKRGRITKKNVLKGYQKFVLKGFKAKQVAGMKIACDAGNGMAGVLLPLLQEKLPAKFDVMFGKLDGRFPNRDSDPTLSKNQRQLKDRLKKKKYDFGISFDGDGDRIAFLDETGKYVNSADIGALIAGRLLAKEPKAKLGYTMLTSRSYEEAIKADGGKPVIMRVGHAFIKDSMRKKDVIFACEHSGHFYFKDYFFTDSVTLTLLAVMEAYAEAKAEGKTFGQMVKPCQKYKQTEDVIVLVKDKKLALAKTEKFITTKLKPKSIKRFDGLVVDCGDVWGGVKVSVTEYALKVMFESANKKLAKETQDKIVAYIKSIANATK